MVTLQNPARLPVNGCRWKQGKSISSGSVAISNCASTRVIFGTCAASNLLRAPRSYNRFNPAWRKHTSYTSCLKDCKKFYRSATMHKGTLVVLVLVLLGILAGVLVWQLGPP